MSQAIAAILYEIFKLNVARNYSDHNPGMILCNNFSSSEKMKIHISTSISDF